LHRARVEVHAARVGAAWQVETWDAAALLLVYPQIGDVVGSTRLAHRLEHLAKTVPSVRRYADLARNGILLSRGDPANRCKIVVIVTDYESQAPRSYTGSRGVLRVEEEPALVAKCKHLAELRRETPAAADVEESETRTTSSGAQAQTAVVGRGNLVGK
jgi:hypothetical protein